MSSPNFTDLEKKFLDAIKGASTPETVEEVRREYLGRNGFLDAILKEMRSLPVSEKQQVGKKLNSLKENIEEHVSKKRSEFERKKLAGELKSEQQDHSLPSRPFWVGKVHPLTRVLQEISDIFLGMGFSIAEGPEIETDDNNFGRLNIPKDHPARDMQDTFYIKGASDLLLRTHTSPVQIREMQRHPPPIRIIVPGKVYRHEAIDATHSSVFHQIEGLAVDESVSFGDLKGTLEIFCKRFFGEQVRTRFRPSYFPFVEPGAEMDISCTICGGGESRINGSGCPVCKGTGWLEMLGAGMVHPNVFSAVGYDPEKVSGFAFGMGIERIAMVRYGVTDMRLFFENHLDFLEQF